MSTKVAIVGFGNIGKYVLDVIKKTPDMELIGVVRDIQEQDMPMELEGIKVVCDIRELSGVETAILSLPSRIVPDYAPKVLELGINTVDSYDVHGELLQLRNKLGKVAKDNNVVSIISAGWDPGTDSIIRAMFEFMLPKGMTYTNFGPGMSMGHSVAVKSIPGVANALSMTIPKGTGIHRRMVYVQIDQNANFESIVQKIKTDPYFVNDETVVFQVEDVEQVVDFGHGVLMERKGSNGSTHNQKLQFMMSINNPALTAQIMVAAARATKLQRPGAYTMIEVPIVDFMYGDRDEIIKHLV